MNYGYGLRLGLVLAILAASCGCAARKPPVLAQAQWAQDRTPVVLLPGITGTQMRERPDGQVLWGDFKSIFWPRDGGYRLALPLGTSDDDPTDLEAFAPVMQLGAGPFKQEAYGSVVRGMESNGFTYGDLQNPRPGDDFFIFNYDWRRETTHSVRQLREQLERLRKARGEEVLHVDLICQSNAALIGRYLAKYGAAGNTLAIDKLIMVGTANGGSLRILRELHRGRTYVRLGGRNWRPETLFTFPALYEALPVHRKDLFFNADGEILEVDLFDAESWERYGWSVFDAKTAKRVERSKRRDLFGTPEERREFLGHRLDTALGLNHRLSADPPGFEPPRYYVIQDAFQPTLERALLVQENDGWRTLFHRSSRVEDDPYLRSLAVAPGDGHATLESQLHLSPAELEALADPPYYIEGGHFEVIVNPAAQLRILQILNAD